jgi:hypothetical protein
MMDDYTVSLVWNNEWQVIVHPVWRMEPVLDHFLKL